ncbi:MAG: glutamate--cysteine ligase [Gammaproteobacteria bacterium]|nr:glutamate--cysteine ligase [Gammaproteobacteria bacterium]
MPTTQLQVVPHLTTATQGPILNIEKTLLEQQAAIESWFRQQWQKTPAPFYGSIDLRNSGFKLAPVDTNLFPAGFNNLNKAFAPLSIHALQATMERICPDAKGILIIPENHTRNQFYLKSLAALEGLFIQAGYQVRLGSLLQKDQPQDIQLDNGQTLRLHPIQRKNDEIYVDGIKSCAILLNNDLSGGRPAILENIQQKIIPPLALGWSQRLKSDHFSIYQQVAAEFSKLVSLDPWLFDPLFSNCSKINFKTREGEDCLAENAAKLLGQIREKYKEHNIDEEPYVVIKADAGTYGMGIMVVKDPSEIYDLNRKQRNKMSFSKEKQKISQVILQEGVPTYESWGDDEDVAEPVIYTIDHFVVGGFYRVHTQRGPTENLNAPGMEFQPLAFAEACNAPDQSRSPDAEPNRFYAFGVIARLALLAAAREIKNAQQ